jgi:DNA polymerase-4
MSPITTAQNTEYVSISLWHQIASVEEALNPQLRNLPMVVANLNLDRPLVLDANASARNLGIRTRQLVSVALRRTPRLIVRPIRSAQIIGFMHTFLKLSRRWGAVVAMNSTQLTIAIPELTLLGRTSLFLKMQNACARELECGITVGFGPTQVYAELARRTLQKPGWQFLQHSDSKKLHAIRIEQLPGVGKRTAEALTKIGITSVGSFAEMPVGKVLSILGRSGLKLYSRARGFNESANTRVSPAAPLPIVFRQMTTRLTAWLNQPINPLQTTNSVV